MQGRIADFVVEQPMVIGHESAGWALRPPKPLSLLECPDTDQAQQWTGGPAGFCDYVYHYSCYWFLQGCGGPGRGRVQAAAWEEGGA